MTAAGPTPADGSILVVPDGLVLPEASLARLRRRFDLRPEGVVGVVAPVAPIPAGSSALTTADAAACASLDEGDVVEGREVAGAALLAPGTEHEVDDRTVRLVGEAAGRLLVDPGATTFDPEATDPEPTPPGAGARPPFRWRAVVVVLASRRDRDRARVGARLADALLARDVEARLALHDPVEGPLLTRPVPADPASVAALRPDLVLALDLDAVALAHEAVAGIRTTVVALVDPDLGDGIELVSWQIERAQGRLRARVGDDVDAGALAALVNRLCSGPVPVPPRDPDPDGATTIAATTVELGARDGARADEPGRSRSGGADPSDPSDPPVPSGDRPHGHRAEVQAVLARGGDPDPVLAGLLDHLEAGGATVHTTFEASAGTGTRLEIDLDRDSSAESERTVVAVVTRGDTDLDAGGRALATTSVTAEQLRRRGVTTIVLPRLVTRAELDRAAAAHARRVRPAQPTIGVVVDPRHPEVGDAVAPVLRAALDLLRAEGHPDLAAVVAATDTPAGEAVAPVPPSLDAPWVTARPTLPDDSELAGWSAAVWLGGPDTADGSGDVAVGAPHALVRAALVGLPVVMAAEAAPAIGAIADRRLTVARPSDAQGWATAIGNVLDEERRSAAGSRARELALALHGDAAAALVASRFLGWCRGGTR